MTTTMTTTTESQAGSTATHCWQIAGMAMTAPRWVLAWMFFSAFWRRVVLEPGKHDPESAGYIGAKFNTFLPNALEPVQSIIEFFVTHPALLYWKLWLFTGIELLVGLALLFGLLSRLSGLGAALLSWGILWGAGWLGSTCLDEWQIGSMGIAIGLAVALAGGGPWSLDAWWQRRWPGLAARKGVWLLSSGAPASARAEKAVARAALLVAAVALALTLFTNQAFHGGVYGQLHNDSVKPHLAITDASLAADGTLAMTVYRDKGPDTYGAFIVSAVIHDQAGNTVLALDAADLSNVPAEAIRNHYLVKARPGPHGLIVPLAARAEIGIAIADPPPLAVPGTYELVLTDVSGQSWSAPLRVRS